MAVAYTAACGEEIGGGGTRVALATGRAVQSITNRNIAEMDEVCQRNWEATVKAMVPVAPDSYVFYVHCGQSITFRMKPLIG